MSLGKRYRTFGLVTLCVFLDWITKFWARDIFGGTKKLIPGLLQIETLQNRGVFQGWFGTFQSEWVSWILVGLNLGICGLLMEWSRRTSALKTQFHIGIACMIGGALGNTLDRALHGYVLDFLVIGPLGVYNFADFAVILGAVLLLVHYWKNVPEEL